MSILDPNYSVYPDFNCWADDSQEASEHNRHYWQERLSRQSWQLMNEALIWLDAEANIILMNQLAEIWFGVVQADTVGLPFVDLQSLPVPFSKKVFEACFKLASPEPNEWEFQWKTASGEPLWIQAKLSQHFIADREFYLLTLSDISASHCVKEALEHTNNHLETLVEDRTLALKKLNAQMKNELEERQYLESQLLHIHKMESVGQLAAGVAHEINNPLGFVISNLTTMLQYFNTLKTIIYFQKDELDQTFNHPEQPELSKKWQACQDVYTQQDLDYVVNDLSALLSETLEGSNRMKDIVQGLKRFSRIDDAMEVKANINECLESTLRIVWNEMKYKCQIVKNLTPVPDIVCFPGQLNQVFMNILMNAFHVVEEKAEIYIETKQDGDHLSILIQDNGHGIDPKHLSKIFEPFFSTKSIGQGTGLGLSISYGIIQKHGGQILVESELGVGTCFRILLPINRCQKTDLESSPVLANAQKSFLTKIYQRAAQGFEEGSACYVQ